MTDDFNSIPARKSKTWLGALPGLVIAVIGFVLATAPLMVLSGTYGTRPVDPVTGWGAVVLSWIGQGLLFIGVVVAVIGLIIKAFVDTSKNRKQ